MKRRIRTYSGTRNPEVTERELTNRTLARRAAAEGIVLLKNQGALPIKDSHRIFLAGNGAVAFIKGGTGSGDVNERETVNILQGLCNCGIEVINKEDIKRAIVEAEAEKVRWANEVSLELEKLPSDSNMGFFKVLEETPKKKTKPVSITQEEVEKSDAVIYVISRVAGEGTDRYQKKGDYYLTDEEDSDLVTLSKYSDNIILLINTGGQVELTEVYKNSHINAIVNISQGGMETGNAVADVLTGKVTPSGKLTNSWTYDYMDYPNSATFSHNNGNTDQELYEEGIYVGYRYFDSFGVKTLFPFGFGLSYTSFELSNQEVRVSGSTVSVAVTVKNTGSYSGKEVVQLYAACPQNVLKKEYRRLVAFKKTKLLLPGEEQTLEMTADAKDFASYDEAKAAWTLEAGEYGLLLGNSSDNTELTGVLAVSTEIVLEKCTNVCPLNRELTEIVRPDSVIQKLTEEWTTQAAKKGIEPIPFSPKEMVMTRFPQTDLDKKAFELANKLTDDELTALLMGEITKGQDNVKDNQLIETGLYIPGAAGETTCALEDKYDFPAISMADGPAGLRLMRKYDVDRATGKIYGCGLLSALEGGIFARDYHNQNADSYYMYATGIPVGTLLAQSWDVALLEEVGKMIGEEMQEFGVSWWLAPGMNIHRNPLCGRNFEYYSEDPLVSGVMAAAITRGVQSKEGVGTTIKHFACNNQEDNRLHSDSVVSERALRELYVRGFEIAVKTSQPMCIMTSYNLVNGVHAANNYDLCTTLARKEWDFKGAIMTDWTTTTAGGSVSHKCALAGNDLIMPANKKDVEDIKAALASGELPRERARECAAHLIKVIYQTIGMEDVPAYGAQFHF